VVRGRGLFRDEERPKLGSGVDLRLLFSGGDSSELSRGLSESAGCRLCCERVVGATVGTKSASGEPRVGSNADSVRSSCEPR
jgi:hypothetical protein